MASEENSHLSKPWHASTLVIQYSMLCGTMAKHKNHL